MVARIGRSCCCRARMRHENGSAQGGDRQQGDEKFLHGGLPQASRECIQQVI
jgi:hypothetical protein